MKFNPAFEGPYTVECPTLSGISGVAVDTYIILYIRLFVAIDIIIFMKSFQHKRQLICFFFQTELLPSGSRGGRTAGYIHVFEAVAGRVTDGGCPSNERRTDTQHVIAPILSRYTLSINWFLYYNLQTDQIDYVMVTFIPIFFY